MVSFENFVKSMTPSLLESKVTPSFCFAFKIPDNPTATTMYWDTYSADCQWSCRVVTSNNPLREILILWWANYHPERIFITLELHWRTTLYIGWYLVKKINGFLKQIYGAYLRNLYKQVPKQNANKKFPIQNVWARKMLRFFHSITA